MEDKTRRLLLALETLALLTAGILILIDYKLKQDLVELTKNVENALEQARTLYPPDANTADHTSDIHTGDMVGDATAVETRLDNQKAGQNGKAASLSHAGTVAKRSRGNRNPEVSRPGNAVGS